MNNHIFFSLLFFLMFDFFYIYRYLDSNIFLNDTGKKLQTLLQNKNYNKKVTFNINVKKIVIKYTICIFLSIIFICYFEYILSNHLIIYKIFDKQIELKSFLGKNIQIFRVIYIILVTIFSIISINIFSKYITYIKKTFKSEKQINPLLNINQMQSIKIKNKIDNEVILIPKETLYKNFLITGSIGCGKTSSAISNISFQLIKSGIGGLILDAKGNFVKTIQKQVHILSKEDKLKIVSFNSEYYFEILDSEISLQEMANILRKVITLLSSNNVSDSYFLDKVENTLFNILILLNFLNKREILEIHNAITNDNYLINIIKEVKYKSLNNVLSDKDTYEITRSIEFFQNEYNQLDKRTLSIIKSEITRLTIPLVTDFEIYKQFLICDGKKKINLNDYRNIVVLSINIGKHRELTKILGTIIKLIYQKKVLESLEVGTDKFIIIDEYQEFVNEEDAYFLSLSRESKCINIMATQSYSSLKSVLKSQETTQVIIQNLVNKIWFRSDDTYTVSKILEFLGKKYFVRETKTYNENGKNTRKRLFKNQFISFGSSLSESVSISKIRENEYTENFFTRELELFTCLMLYIGKENLPLLVKIKFDKWEDDYE